MKWYVKYPDGKIGGPLEQDVIERMRDAVDDSVMFSEDFFATKVVTGSIEGGVLSLGEVPEGVEVKIRDYDVTGGEEGMQEDENGDSYFEVG